MVSVSCLLLPVYSVFVIPATTARPPYHRQTSRKKQGRGQTPHETHRSTTKTGKDACASALPPESTSSQMSF
ncbi:hypothetical protein P691DRAFT_805423, partial [Macrolepiota fuliginosa MF-IS2]